MNSKEKIIRNQYTKVMVLSIFLLFTPFVNAAYIDVSSQVPAKIAFLFSVELPESSYFTHSQILLEKNNLEFFE